MTANVRNKDTGCLESATQVTCPRCHGGGRAFADIKLDQSACSVCDGRGVVWKSTFDSGWYRHLGKQVNKSFKW